jgi:enoyl-CoA hydratase/carnithine racemase
MSALRLSTRPDSVAVLTLDQPDSKANVLTPGLWAELASALDTVAARPDLKGLVLASAKPGVFIAGADLNLLGNAPGPGDPAVRGFIEQGLRVLEKLESLPFPSCAAIGGAALGGGLEVALACDHRIGESNPKLRLGLPEVTLGLIPGWGGTQRLSRVVGLTLAAEMVTSGRSLEAREGLQVGLLAKVVDSAKLLDAAAGLALSPGHVEKRTRKQQPVPRAVRDAFAGTLPLGSEADRVAARVMIDGAALPLKQAINLETEAFLRLAGSEESRRLIAAFFAARKK